MVFYRKYRSQTIDELDNAHIRETLFSVLQKDTPHAFLFTGPKGLGKTSTARIIAKVVNCTNHEGNQSSVPSGKAIEPCNACDQCISITNGTNMDVLEIDAASNRGIDEIRDLKEKIRLAPLSAAKKVYIIDEVHMLTTEAFNALLKTLEEPPEHAMFILCTTEPHKVPATILSRSFHLQFKLASLDELVRSFKRVAKGEGVDIDNDALAAIAELAEGGFRDGAKIMEEMVTIANGKKITKELIEEKYKVSSIHAQVSQLFAALEKKDKKAGLQIIAGLVEQGVDMKYFLQQLLEGLHDRMLEHVGVKQQVSGKNQAIGLAEIKILVELFSKAYAEMKYAVLAQLPLELAIIEYCYIAQSPEADQNESQAPSVSTTEQLTKNGVTVSSMRKQLGTIAKIKALYGDKAVDKTEEAPAIELTKVELMQAAVNGNITAEWQNALWKHIISEMKSYNHTIAGVLRSCYIKSYDNKQLVIETPYKFHKERLDDMKTRERLLEVCKLLTGKEVSVTVELKK